MKNYYQIIGVDVDSSKETIKNAYLLKIKKYHPDVYTGDKDFAMQKTLELNQAYEVLKDETKRAEYDKKNNIHQNSTRISPIKEWWIGIKLWWKNYKQMYEIGKENKKKDKKKKKKEKPKLSQEEQQERNDNKKLILLIGATIIAILIILLILVL